MNYADKKLSKWTTFANQEVNWHGLDSAELYSFNLLNNYDKLKNNDWINKTFTYKFNSHGFRCEEFTDADAIMFLGCSFTLGTGLPLDNIFPFIVSEKLNLKCYNLGVGGSSADTGFRLTKIYLEKLKPKILVTIFLFPERTELLTSQLGDIHFTPNNLANLDVKSFTKNNQSPVFNNNSYLRKYYIDFYEKWLENPSNTKLNYLKNTLAIAKLCDNLKIKHLDYASFSKIDISDTLEHPSKARDLIHPGTEIHKNIAQNILEEIN